MTRYRVLPYRTGSRGATALAQALGGRRLRLEGSTFRCRDLNDVVINWGNTEAPRVPFARGLLLNEPGAIRQASNKLLFFNRMQELDAPFIPRFWTRREDIPDDAFPIVCRTVLAGHSGEGIIIANTRDDLVAAPLYVQYIKKQDEYRVHVGKRNEEESIIIAVQRKARREGYENPNWQVRNHDNGFVYVREGFITPPSVLTNAQEALRATGLDFGAVDVIYNARQERAYVLEINTAPGLEGQTVEDYAAFFRGLR